MLSAIRLGHTVRDACALAGIGKSTWYEWVQRHGLEEEVDQAELSGVSLALTAVQNAFQTDWRAAVAYLKMKRPREWSDRVEHVGPDGGAVQMEISTLSDDELLAKAAEIVARRAPGLVASGREPPNE